MKGTRRFRVVKDQNNPLHTQLNSISIKLGPARPLALAQPTQHARRLTL